MNKSIAVIGASNNPEKYGNKAVLAFQEKGFRVFPVNPRETQIAGIPAFSSIAEVPEKPDIISLYIRPEQTLPILDEIIARGCGEIWLNPGTASDELIEALGKSTITYIEQCSLVALSLGNY